MKRAGGAVRATALVLVAACRPLLAEAPAPDGEGDVSLLKMPYPHRAALTVLSDTHPTERETFEAVHTLINTRQRIDRGSDTWRRLFTDPEIERRAAWREGIQGFGLPVADTLWLYHPVIGVFAFFDRARGRPVPHYDRGRDFRDVVDGWLQRGWMGALHALGPGHQTREAAAAGFAWLQERPHRRLRVWVNHSLAHSPSNIEPDERALRPIIGNLARRGGQILTQLGLGGFAGRLGLQARPRTFPPDQRTALEILNVLLVGGGAWVGLCLLWRPLRKPWPVAAAALTVLLAAAALHATRLRYAQGDNPDSLYYQVDIARRAGFRYFWFIQPMPGYPTHVSDRLALPEKAVGGGRTSCLGVATLDDGSPVLVFSRVQKGGNDFDSLQLLTEEGLRDLVENQGTSVIYVHWTETPPRVFTAASLDGLERLRLARQEGRIWVAPAAEILHFTFVRAFLEYSVARRQGRRVVDLKQVRDPTGPPFEPTLEDLSGISLTAPAGEPIEVRVAGRPLAPQALEWFTEGDRIVVRFPWRALGSQAAAPGG